MRNRDIPLMREILYIMQEICQIEKLQEWQRDRMLNVTQHLSFTPGGKGLPKGIEDAFAILSGLETEHEAKCAEYGRKLKEAEEILNGIENLEMRTFVLMKYVMDVPDTQIRRDLNMSEWAFNQAKKCIEEAGSMKEVVWRGK